MSVNLLVKINLFHRIPEPIFRGVLTVHLRCKMTNKRFLVKGGVICAQEIVSNSVNTMMVDLLNKYISVINDYTYLLRNKQKTRPSL